MHKDNCNSQVVVNLPVLFELMRIKSSFNAPLSLNVELVNCCAHYLYPQYKLYFQFLILRDQGSCSF